MEIDRDDLVKSYVNGLRWQEQDDIGLMFKATDRERWHMTPQTVNA
jgi:predicted metalloendopeptidase